MATEIFDRLQDETTSLEEKLIIYNKEVKSLAITSLDYNQPRIPNSSENIICYCRDCKLKYTEDEINSYLKLRETEVERIKKETDPKNDYENRVRFALDFDSSKASLNIKKNPLNHKEGFLNLYDVNPTSKKEEGILKELIREQEDKNFNPEKRQFYKVLKYQPFRWLKEQFSRKINQPLSNLESVIDEEIKLWIEPISKNNNATIFRNLNEIYQNIKSSRQEKVYDDCFVYYYKLLVVEERIKYELYLDEIRKDPEAIEDLNLSNEGRLLKKTPKKNNNSNQSEEPYLKDLFVDGELEYNKIINLLKEKKFITKNNDQTLNWKGAQEDSSLANKTLICTLAVLLNNKDYFKPNLTNIYIAKALTNSFKSIKITEKTFGETRNKFCDKPHYSSVFSFIPLYPKLR